MVIVKILKHISGQRNIEFSRDVTFDEDVTLGKARDLPPAEKKGDDDIIEGLSIPKYEEFFYDPMEPMDPLDPPPSDKKRPLWFRDTLQYVEIYVLTKRNFRGSKKPCRYQGYVVAIRIMIQAEPSIF